MGDSGLLQLQSAYYDAVKRLLMQTANEVSGVADGLFRRLRQEERFLQRPEEVSDETLRVLGLSAVERAMAGGTVFKGGRPSNLVSAIEFEIRTLLQDRLQQHAGNLQRKIAFLSEESAEDNVPSDAPALWIADELDGSVNFWDDRREYAIHLAYAEREDAKLAIKVGVIATPGLGRHIYTGIASQTPERDGIPIGRRIVSRSLREADITACLFNTATGPAELETQVRFGQQLMAAVLTEFRSFRSYGSFGVSAIRVATGRDQVYVHPNPALWDFASAVPIVRGVGGYITGLDGKDPVPRKPVVVSNGVDHQDVLRILKQYSLGPQ